MRAVAIVTGVVMLMSAGCGRTPQPVPKPDAWPRIEPYGEAYSRDIDGFAVNDSALVAAGDSAGWYTVVYPRYGGAILYLTFATVEPARIDNVLDTRAERMALNSGGGRSSITHLVSEGGFDCSMMRTPAGTVTPLQFLASRGDGRVVTGALFIDGASVAQPDSFAPVVDAVERDLLHALKHLR